MSSVIYPVIIVLGTLALFLLFFGLVVDSILKRLEEDYERTEDGGSR